MVRPGMEPLLARPFLGNGPAFFTLPGRLPFGWVDPRSLATDEERSSPPRAAGPPADAADRGCGGRMGSCVAGDGMSPVRLPESSDCPGGMEVPPVATVGALPNFRELLIILSSSRTTLWAHNTINTKQLLYNLSFVLKDPGSTQSGTGIKKLEHS